MRAGEYQVGPAKSGEGGQGCDSRLGGGIDGSQSPSGGMFSDISLSLFRCISCDPLEVTVRSFPRQDGRQSCVTGGSIASCSGRRGDSGARSGLSCPH